MKSNNKAHSQPTKTLLVTGGSKGIGRAVCLAAVGSYKNILFTYADDDRSATELVQLLSNQGAISFAYKSDASVVKDIDALVETVSEQFGRPDAMVCNAAITGGLSRFSDSEFSQIQKVFDTNVLGLMYLCKQMLKKVLKDSEKVDFRIVNVSSTAADTGSPNEYVAYAASKAAVETFTKGLAKELASHGVRINAVAPGTTQTGIHERSGDPDRTERVARILPMQRVAEPSEIALSILWLLSDDASYINGSVLRVSGGA